MSALGRRSILKLGLLLLTASLATLSCRKKPALEVLGQLASFELTRENGERFGSKELAGKTWVAAFMFTRCPTICPRITQRMREVQSAAQTRQIPLTLVSFSVDPEYDTPEVLTRYAAAQKVDLANWRFLTGDYALIQKTAEQGFKLALEGRADAAAEHYGISHGSHLVLVDGQARIRGYYRSSDDEEMARLVEDAARLVQ
jgi:protein SCO1/2